jgi:all-trans-retinol 13,14-reductase
LSPGNWTRSLNSLEKQGVVMGQISEREDNKLFSHNHEGVEENWDVIVIGSGIGGMSCASALAQHNKKVLVVEQHYIPGGMTHMFSRNGFEWDVGVHVIGEMGSDDVTGKHFGWLTDNKVKMISQGNPSDKFLFSEGTVFDFPDTEEQFVKNLKNVFPEESEKIDAYISIVSGFRDDAYFVLKILPERIANLISKVLYKFKRDWWRVTTDEVLAELGISGRLRTVLTTQWGYIGATPNESSFAAHAVVQRHFMSGSFYPEGGSKTLSEHILSVVVRNEGKILTQASVERILIKKNRAYGIKLSSGKEFYAKRIVSAASIKNTVNKLMPKHYRESRWGKEINSLGQSPSYISVNLGFDSPIKELIPQAPNLWIYNTMNFNEKVWNFNEVEEPPMIYISFPSLKNGANKPKKHTGECVIFVPWEPFEKWKNSERSERPQDYLKLKIDLEKRVVRSLNKNLPKLMEKCTYINTSTPVTTEYYTRSVQGSAYGLESTPKRYKCSALRVRTPVKKLYMTGADVGLSGIAGVMMSGVLTAATIDPRVFLKFR